MPPICFLRLTSASLLLLTNAAGGAAFDYFQPLPDQPPVPTDNPQSPARIALGKRLYFDAQLSLKQDQSCNSCHDLRKGGDDDQALSTGQAGSPGTRNAPGLWNIGLQTVLYWDGRSERHELQAMDHLLDPQVMAMSEALISERLARDGRYAPLFLAAFGPHSATSLKNVAYALAAFERSLRTPDSRFDRHLRGDQHALTAAEKRGMQLFNDVGCLACHFGVNFAGPAPGPALGLGQGFYELFPNTLGTPYDARYELTKDLGRFAYSKDVGEKYMWRVPPLRNIELTAPYFHNGSVSTLEEAVRVMAVTQLRKTLNAGEVDDITAFLKTLTGQIPVIEP